MVLNHGWTKENLEYLKSHYSAERTADISKVIGKTVNSIHHKANKLGLYKDKEAFSEVRSKASSGANSGNFKNYRRRTPKGYIVRYIPDHPMASAAGLVMEHRLVVEEHLGYYLPQGFDVHHINGVKDDNRIENLAVMTHKAHTLYHNTNRGKKHE